MEEGEEGPGEILNVWIHKFARLAYIAYLDTERTIRDIALAAFAAGVGMWLYFLFMANLEIPSDYSPVAETVMVIGIWNALLTLLFLAIFAVLGTFTVSFISVSYRYDDCSWFDKLNAQLDEDRKENLRQKKLHRDITNALIKEMKLSSK